MTQQREEEGSGEDQPDQDRPLRLRGQPLLAIQRDSDTARDEDDDSYKHEVPEKLRQGSTPLAGGAYDDEGDLGAVPRVARSRLLRTNRWTFAESLSPPRPGHA